MDKLAKLNEVIGPIAGLAEDELSVSLPLWRTRKILKGEFYNRQNVVCKDLGIVLKGIFRIYYYDPAADQEKNVYFFSENQFLVSFRSFLFQYPCSYYIEALEDSEILYMDYHDLQKMYSSSKAWERFGRLLAEHFFNHSQGRAEDLLFLTHEKRYLNLLEEHPNIVKRIQGYHIASYLGVKNQSLSRIRKRLTDK